MATSASSAITGAITTNIFLSVILGVSMKKLWMMITTLQIIVNQPLLKVYLPANAILCFKAIVDISNINIIPKEYIDMIMGFISSDKGDDTEGNF
jgi:hypothetical protein